MGLQIVLIIVALLGIKANLTDGAFAQNRPLVPSVTVSGTPGPNKSDLPVRGEIRKTHPLSPNAKR